MSADLKKALRKSIEEKKKLLDENAARESDREIARRLFELPEYRRAKAVFTFVSVPGEVDTKPIILDALASAKRVCVPRCVSRGVMKAYEISGFEDLETGKYGIQEPKDGCAFVAPEEIEFVIVPCATCDVKGNRLGYGGGFYDRYLLKVNSAKAALCRTALLSEEIPTEPHDLPVDIVITDRRVYSARIQGEEMNFTKKSCEEFIEVLASKEPVPGGGGASALVGAIGVALGNMVGALTIGKKKYANVQDDIIELNEKAAALAAELLNLVEKDAKAFEPLAKAYGMPADTDEQKAKKSRVMEAALKEACLVPLEIMEKCCSAIDLHQKFAKKGAAIAISDAGCGVVCCKAALQAAALNVFINTKSMTDKAYAKEINSKADKLLEIYAPRANEIYASVAARFKETHNWNY
jgi:5,10-methenyltetrahydrofolate synthetase